MVTGVSNALDWRRIGNGTFASTLLFAVAFAVGLSELAGGCASATSEPARVPDEHSGYIARPCPPLKEQRSQGGPIALVLEVADVEEAIGSPIKDWLALHPVQIRSVAKFILPLTATAAADRPSDTCSDRPCGKAVDGTLEVTVAGAPTTASAPLELQLARTLADGATRRVSVKTTDQEPALASFTTAPKQTLVLMPYYVFEPKQQSMDLLLQCAAREAGPIRAGDKPASVPLIEPAR